MNDVLRVCDNRNGRQTDVAADDNDDDDNGDDFRFPKEVRPVKRKQSLLPCKIGTTWSSWGWPSLQGQCQAKAAVCSFLSYIQIKQGPKSELSNTTQHDNGALRQNLSHTLVSLFPVQ